MRPIPRYVGMVVLLAMAGFAGVGYFAIRRDVDNLRVISQDNILWSATQMEVELLRFQLSMTELAGALTPEAVAAAQERFDIFWSRVFIMRSGRVGEVMRAYDEGHGSLETIAEFMERLDPVIVSLDPGDVQTIDGIIEDLRRLQQELRLYTLRVVRADAAAAAVVRDRIQLSAQTTAVIAIAAVGLSVLALFLILRENRRQRDLVAMTQRIADEAERSSRAKSIFLSMMSHELRNPLNGVLGPLALLVDGDALGDRQARLVEQAQQSARVMLRMLRGLLDYAEMQDGRLTFLRAPLGIDTLAGELREALVRDGSNDVRIVVAPGVPERVEGDLDRLTQIFMHLTEFALELRAPGGVELTLDHDGEGLIGEVRFAEREMSRDWRRDLLPEDPEAEQVATGQVSTEALRPLIARGLITACGGRLTLDSADGVNLIRVEMPAPAAAPGRVRVWLETRSAALATIYQAALKSEQLVFLEEGSDSLADVVLVDSAGIDDASLIEKLRERFPSALVVSLGTPQQTDLFDYIVDPPNDMGHLRESILTRLAS